MEGRDKINLSISDFIMQWNQKYPFDRWWRKKYNIPFGSKAHREANFIDMSIDYNEDLLFEKMRKKNKENPEDKALEKKIDEIIEGGNLSPEEGKKLVKLSKEDIDKEFEDINLADFN